MMTRAVAIAFMVLSALLFVATLRLDAKIVVLEREVKMAHAEAWTWRTRAAVRGR